VFQIVRAIRGKPVGARVGVVLIGDDLNADVRRQGRQAGVAAFLQRPYDLGSVEAALLVATAPSPEEPGDESARAREALLDTLHRLRKVSLFAGFSDADLVRLLKICRSRRFSAGTCVFREGEVARSLYVLVAGRLEIRTAVDGVPQVLVEMGPGDCFGEIAIVDTAPRSADAVAATDCIVIEVAESVVNNNEDLLSLKLVRQIAILLAKKLRRQTPSRTR
jgi:hypothetical protein